jgi:hypothetical protein
MKDQRQFKGGWEAELDFSTKDEVLAMRDQEVSINLVNSITGEIRQKRVSIDFIAQRVFRGEIETWRKKYGEDILIKK